MGNTSTSQDRSICGLNFFSSKDATQTILQSKPARRSKLRSQTSIPKTQETVQSSTDNVLTKKGKSSDDIIERSTRQRSHTYLPSLKDPKDVKEKSNLSENDFRILQKLAKGRYGKICIVRKGDGDEVFAMKVLCKKKIAFQRRDEVAMMEKDILQKASHPFIPKLVYFFENERNFFLVVEYIEGGELHKILKQLTRFSEEITKFYSAEVLLVLEYLHEQLGFRYNDLKPENVLLDVEGHIKLIDFDFSERIEDHNKDLLSSKGKMESPSTKLTREAKEAKETKESSPEIMIDYWKFGCFIYELLSGKPLFPHAKNGSKVIEEQIIEEDMEWPQSISKNAKDLIIRLLNPKIEERLGYNGIQEIKKHPFFSHINWEKMLQKAVYPPLNPSQFKENMKEEEEEQESDVENVQESVQENNVHQCSLGHIPDPDQTKGDTITISEDLSMRTPIHNRTSMPNSHPDVSMARST